MILCIRFYKRKVQISFSKGQKRDTQMHSKIPPQCHFLNIDYILVDYDRYLGKCVGICATKTGVLADPLGETMVSQQPNVTPLRTDDNVSWNCGQESILMAIRFQFQHVFSFPVNRIVLMLTNRITDLTQNGLSIVIVP